MARSDSASSEPTGCTGGSWVAVGITSRRQLWGSRPALGFAAGHELERGLKLLARATRMDIAPRRRHATLPHHLSYLSARPRLGTVSARQVPSPPNANAGGRAGPTWRRRSRFPS